MRYVNFAIQNRIRLYSKKSRKNSKMNFEAHINMISIFSENFRYYKASKGLKTIHDTLKKVESCQVSI